eukprot:7981495-Alexandrium_andersonii.AAC.1
MRGTAPADPRERRQPIDVRPGPGDLPVGGAIRAHREASHLCARRVQRPPERPPGPQATGVG